MSTNCVRCVKNTRTGHDLLCDGCRDQERDEKLKQQNDNQPELTEEEKQSILAVRNKRDAKTAAEKLCGRKVRPKVVRGYCCLFPAGRDYTDYFGHTWQEAFMTMLFRRKLGAESPQSQDLKKEVRGSEVPA
jgi:hypothetical protein